MQKINSISNKSIAYIYFTVWAICVLIAFTSCHQKNTHNKISIVGKITDANSAVEIAGADIYLVANEFDGSNFMQYPITQIESDADGNYQITADVNNEVEFGIEVRKKGYEKTSNTITLKSGIPNTINFKLNKVTNLK